MATSAAGEVFVAIEFEPALPEPARLQVVHESGAVREVATQCTGVVLSLPPGPASLRLVVGECSLERALHVQPGMATMVWNLARVP